MSEWIKCSDRIPEPCHVVLCEFAGDYEFGMVLGGVFKVFLNYEWTDPKKHGAGDVIVSIWSELPKLPSEKEARESYHQ